MPKTDSNFDPEAYTPVAERVLLFYSRYPRGRITTRLVSYENGRVVVEASVFRCESSSHPAATGLASEHERDGEINAVACLENTETSAIGRALANLGITGSVRRPSREEMEKAARARSVAEPNAINPDGPENRRQHSSPGESANSRTKPSTLGSASFQEEANEHLFVLKLLARAERSGLPAERARELRTELDALSLDGTARERIAAELRVWLRRHVGFLRREPPGPLEESTPHVPTTPL